MSKLLSRSRDSDNSSNGFHGSKEDPEKQLIIIETSKGIYRVRICLKDVFRFAEHQDSCTYSLG